MSNAYGGHGFGGPGFGDRDRGGFGGFGSGGDGGKGFGGAGMSELFDVLGQLKQNVEHGFGARFDMKAGGRMGRGDVRVAILALLAERPMHGYQIIQQIDERSGGAWKPSPGSVYPTLQLLADEGMVEVNEQDGRKTYALTEAGRAEAADKPAPWQTSASAGADPDAPGRAAGDGPGFGALPKAGANLAQAAMQVGRMGSPAQVQRAVDIIDEARRKLYAILAED
ncbi:PadR family transcriptional regulator [Microbacterium dextranolyticum]|uniref:Transcriptional regulator n=1 Tax=Microbacterium dextranolyticum TaxID=36806 RepID=A0A9W6HKY8_9MICO|nr:PadR family transcriptional regulator [Microbacterium dextranolyticum]MBM7462290.1 DNA-binding PadR family transcriptional regulator [Microbacterium dextranolyticum]GLJ94540.1 transcriptional regulator [Microbacterium dextranolyticum]